MDFWQQTLEGSVDHRNEGIDVIEGIAVINGPVIVVGKKLAIRRRNLF